MINNVFAENADGGKLTFRGVKFDLGELLTRNGVKWVITGKWPYEPEQSLKSPF